MGKNCLLDYRRFVPEAEVRHTKVINHFFDNLLTSLESETQWSSFSMTPS